MNHINGSTGRLLVRAMLVLLAGCSTAPGSDTPTVAAGHSLENRQTISMSQLRGDRGAIQSCALRAPRLETVNLQTIMAATHYADRTWLLARARPSRDYLLYLDERGDVREIHGSFRSTETVVVEHAQRSLRVVSTWPEARWWSVDVSDPDEPRPGAGMAFALQAPGPALGDIDMASNGRHAFISAMSYVDEPNAISVHQNGGIYRMSSGERTGVLPSLYLHDLVAVERGFVAAVSEGGRRELALVHFEPDGTQTLLHALGYFGLGRPQFIRHGDHWYVAWSPEGSVEMRALDLDTMELSSAQMPLPEERQAEASQLFVFEPEPRWLRVGHELGFLAGETLDTWFRVNESLTVIEAHRFPGELGPVGERVTTADGLVIFIRETGQERIPLSDGSIRIQSDQMRGNMYFLRWHEQQGLVLEDRVTTPYWTMSASENRIELMVRPGHVVAMIQGERMHVLRLREPCPASW